MKYSKLSVDLSKFDFSSVNNINEMFIGYNSLKALYISDISGIIYLI